MKDGFLKIYLIIATVLLGIMFLGFFLKTDVNYAYFWGHQTDTFGDYFNCIRDVPSLSISYETGNIYPPLCWFIFYICRKLSGNVQEIMVQESGQAYMLRTYQAPTMIFTILLMICILLIYSLISELWNFEKLKKQWAVFLLMLSIPFLFMIERGNIIIISLIGTLVFFVTKDSENYLFRAIGYLCLAVAAAIKVYPAIFGFLLIWEKKYKEALKLAICGIIVFSVPFLLFCEEGIAGIPLFFKNLLGFDSLYTASAGNQLVSINVSIEKIRELLAMDTGIRDGSRIGYAAFMERFLLLFNISVETAIKMAAWLGNGLTALAFTAAFCAEKEWQTVLLLTCAIAGGQNKSYVYTAVFFLIPFILFINKEKRSGWNSIYFILLILILFPLPFGWTENLHERDYYIWHRSFNDLQIGGALWCITIISVLDSWRMILKRRYRQIHRMVI